MTVSVNQAGIYGVTGEINYIGITTSVTFHTNIITNIDDFTAENSDSFCAWVFVINRVDDSVFENDVRILATLRIGGSVHQRCHAYGYHYFLDHLIFLTFGILFYHLQLL